MKQQSHRIILMLVLMFPVTRIHANFISATPANYTTYLSTLVADDTLFLQAGTYVNQLNINNLNGTNAQPIVILGASQASVIFSGNACCNTVSITKSSWIIIMDFTIDGMGIVGIDAVKAEGTTANWAHHITVENLRIIGQGGDQQNVGISTKCTAWDWVIRRNRIETPGTGMYLGNSNGAAPFVNGIIEGNLITDAIGYCIEIKQQNDSLRTIPGMTLNGKTILRNNVFCKGVNSSTGGLARPNVLVGAFPSVGDGAADLYEIYRNFFYNNPVEGLLQATGNLALYGNIFVNPDSGGWGVQIRQQNGFSPRNMTVFHNTILVKSGTGLNFYNCDTQFHQNATANAVFATPAIVSSTPLISADNVTDTYSNSANFLFNPLLTPPNLQTYPLAGHLTGLLVSDSLFQSYDDYNLDFTGANFNWTYRGAYSASGPGYGWVLQCDTMPFPDSVVISVEERSEDEVWAVFPDPSNDILYIRLIDEKSKNFDFTLYDFNGKELLNYIIKENKSSINISGINSGIYLAKLTNNENFYTRKIILVK